MYIILFLICFLASVVGAICGIGGGVIIKPVLDAAGVMDVSTISFLSGCTVLSMTSYSVLRSKMKGESEIEPEIGIPIAIGATLGGLAGKWLFSYIRALSENQNKVGLVQSICLLLVTMGTLAYTLYKEKITTYHIRHSLICILIGLFLGILSSFLGIGGGPINLVVLFFFFSMPTKKAAETSLYIILFSQLTSILLSAVRNSVPVFDREVLVLMSLGGIIGGIVGRFLNSRIKEKTVEKLFMALMILIIAINIYNIYNFSKLI